MTYQTFLEQSYRALREEAPPVWQIDRLEGWVRSIGELLLHMPGEVQREWAEQYAVLIMITYGYIAPDIARVCVRHGLTEAEARWPNPLQRVR